MATPQIPIWTRLLSTLPLSTETLNPVSGECFGAAQPSVPTLIRQTPNFRTSKPSPSPHPPTPKTSTRQIASAEEKGEEPKLSDPKPPTPPPPCRWYQRGVDEYPWSVPLLSNYAPYSPYSPFTPYTPYTPYPPLHHLHLLHFLKPLPPQPPCRWYQRGVDEYP